VKFDEIKGQQKTKAYLKKLVDKNKMPHAFLFTGPGGNGKLAMALAFASYMQCRDRSGNDSCGVCASCHKSQQFIHPDIHFVMPTVSTDGKSNPSSAFYEPWRQLLSKSPYLTLIDWANEINLGTNKKFNIPAVSMFELIKIFNLKIFEGQKKIAIIWQAELMGKEGNRLLKLIEEPPPNSVFIIVTDHEDQLLNTIVSRCQIIKIPPFQDADLQSYASEHFAIAEDLQSEFVDLANGNIIELRQLMHKSNAELNKQFFDWLRICYRAESVAVLDWADEFHQQSNDNKIYFYKYGLSFFEQYLRSFAEEGPKIRLTRDAQKVAENMKSVIDEMKAIKIISLLNDCIINLSRNANVKLQMINSSLTLHRIMMDKKE
jgi:DNA polymerase-3 subunit delta'